MQKEIYRLKKYLEDFPDLDVWIISQTGMVAKLYWSMIKEHVKTDKKPLFISKKNKEGINPSNAIILLCGCWYKNPIAFSDIFKMHLSNARFTFPVGEIPNSKGHDDLYIMLSDREIDDILTLANIAFNEGFGNETQVNTVKKLESILIRRKEMF